MRKERGVYLLDVMLLSGEWTEVTVDSGAADNVCPLGWAECFSMQAVQDGQRQNFVGPNGSPINHYGCRDVVVKAVASTF